MRKSYKPIARTEKASQMYRKKTLNVTDSLNIKHDDNQIEDVDEYWAAAASVIGNQSVDALDDTVVTEQSETLFNINNIRRSIKLDPVDSHVNEKIDKKSKDANTSKDTPSLPKENKENVPLKKRLTLKPEDEVVSSESSQSRNISEDVTGFDGVSNEKVSSIDEPSHEDNNNDILSSPHQDGFSFEGSSVAKDSFVVISSQEKVDSFGLNPSILVKQTTDTVLKGETEIKNSNNTAEKKRTMLKYRKVTKKTENTKKHTLQIQSVKQAEKVNKIMPLVCTKSINTAMMTFDYMAFINDTVAENSFSLYVIKGRVVIKLNGLERTMKNGEATVVEKSDLYSVRCISEKGASLFASYIL